MTCDWCYAKDDITDIMRKYYLQDKGLDNALGYWKCECKDEDSESDYNSDDNNSGNDLEDKECEIILNDLEHNYKQIKDKIETYLDNNAIDYKCEDDKQWAGQIKYYEHKYSFDAIQRHIDNINSILERYE